MFIQPEELEPERVAALNKQSGGLFVASESLSDSESQLALATGKGGESATHAVNCVHLHKFHWLKIVRWHSNFQSVTYLHPHQKEINPNGLVFLFFTITDILYRLGSAIGETLYAVIYN